MWSSTSLWEIKCPSTFNVVLVLVLNTNELCNALKLAAVFSNASVIYFTIKWYIIIYINIVKYSICSIYI